MEAQALGHSGVRSMSQISGLARSTIYHGLSDIRDKVSTPPGRLRREGGGRKKKIIEDPTVADLESLVAPVTRGDPMRPLLWTSRGLPNLVTELTKKRHTVSPTVIGDLLHDMGYSLQANNKTREGDQHIKGREWRRQGSPELVNVHDFIDSKLKRAVSYGVYDITNNVGWVSVGTDHDTASFTVHVIRRWWRTMGKKRHPRGKRLMISADGGGSNGYCVQLWKVELQALADELKLPITVCDLPPRTSKWNKIEHRLFSFISINWLGKPLRSYRTIVQLIAATTTNAGLKVQAELDETKYPKGIKVSDTRLATVNISRHSFLGDWNYTISPTRTARVSRK